MNRENKNIPIAEFDRENRNDFALTSLESLSEDREVHSHDFYAVIWFERGRCEHIIDFKSYEITPGRFHFLAPGKVHTMRLEEPMHGQALSFPESFLTGPESRAPLWHRYPFFSYYRHAEFVPEENETALFRSMVTDIEEEASGSYEDRFGAIQQILNLLLIRINRRYGPGAGDNSGVDRKEQAYFRDFMMLLHEHFRTERSVGFYARRLGITASHLSACARTVSGLPISRLIQERTVLEIKRMLRYSELPVYKISDELRFEDAAYLTKFFKKHTGQTPREFRGV